MSEAVERREANEPNGPTEPSGPTGPRQWKLTRNCAMSPRRLGLQVGAIASVIGAVGGGFWWLGYPGVAVFCGIEVLFLVGAVRVYARHAVDGERIRLDRDALWIESVNGGEVRACALHPAWVRLEHREGSAPTLRCGGMRVRVGRHVGDAQRRRFVAECAEALAAIRAGRPGA